MDMQEARYNRMNRMNPPKFAPGQGSPAGGGAAPFGANSQVNSAPGGSPFGARPNPFASGATPGATPGGAPGGSPFGARPNPFGGATPGGTPGASPFGARPTPFGGGGAPGGSPFGGGAPGGSPFGARPSFGGNPFIGANGMGAMQQNQQAQQSSTEDKVWDIAEKAGKGTVKFTKSMASSFGENGTKFWLNYGKHTMFLGLGFAAFGFVSKIFGLGIGLQVSIGGLLTAALGMVVFLFSADKFNKGDVKPDKPKEVEKPQEEIPPAPVSPTPPPPPSQAVMWDDLPEDDEKEEEEEEEDDELEWNSTERQGASSGMDIDEALETAQTFEKGMYVRQYLYDMFTKVLPSFTPGFATFKELDESDDDFMFWVEAMQDAGSVAGCKEDAYPELLEYKENLFTIQMVSDRPAGLKPDILAKELANIYAQEHDLDIDITFKVKTVANKCYITLFTGKSAMVSLMDMYNNPEVKDYVKDESHMIPVVFGIDTQGKVLKRDMRELESMLITGMPRSGKSWFVQAILYQMCAFMPPTQLHLYVCDPKGDVSDFRRFTLPHVKKFEKTVDGILKTLSDLVYKEGARRKKLIGDAGHVNIWDYKKEFPDVKLPVIYVVIDEIMTLTSDMDKESLADFFALLRMLISQLPALGIRALLIPHLVNNKVIDKKITDLIMCRVSVRGTPEVVEHVTGAKPSQFPYALVNVGDMAVYISGERSVQFIHGPVLTDDNQKNNQLFAYARRVWRMLEPDEDATCVAATADKVVENEKLLERIEQSVEEDELDLGFLPQDTVSDYSDEADSLFDESDAYEDTTEDNDSDSDEDDDLGLF